MDYVVLFQKEVIPEGGFSFLNDPDLVEKNGIALIDPPGADFDNMIERLLKASRGPKVEINGEDIYGREISGHLILPDNR